MVNLLQCLKRKDMPMKKAILLSVMFLTGCVAHACYGELCSTQVGTLYDYPWKVINQYTKPYPTSAISVLDGSYKMEDLPYYKPHQNTHNYTYKMCTNGNCKTYRGNNP